MSNQIRDQYLLRVKHNSPMERVMDALTSGKVTEGELKVIGGQNQWGYRVQRLAKWLDNLAIVTDAGGKQKANYFHPGASTPIEVLLNVPAIPSQAILDYPIAPEPVHNNGIRWPDAPPLIDGMGDKYRMPGWFSVMREMVHRGRHIALSGPPGVGKDTAVQELAAEQGRVLVTVGGDGGFRRRDLVGSIQISQGRSFMEVGEYAAAVVNGWWVLLSEVNAADADALIFINSQLAPPYVINVAGKSYPVHPEFRLFVTYNPGLVGTKPLPQSFKDRYFSIQVPFFSTAQMISLLMAHGAPDALTTIEIAKYGLILWQAHERGQIRYQVTSRRLMDAVELLKADLVTGVREALEMAVVAAIDSLVEAKVATQLINNI